MRKICVIALFFISSLGAQTDDPYYDYKFRDKLLYLHALVNYDFHPLWYQVREQNMLSRNSLLLTFGSVETRDLQSILYIRINEPLAGGLWFLYRGELHETQITHTSGRIGYLGLEKSVYKNGSLFLLVNPAFKKEEVDMQAGFRISDTSRESYFSLALVLEDFVYTEKNTLGGSDAYQPKTIRWLSRRCWNALTFYTEGVFSTGFERRFPNREKSPVLTGHRQKINTADVKLYYFLTPVRILNLGFSHYHFHESKQFVLNSGAYDFRNRYFHYYLEFLSPLRSGFHVRLAARYLHQCGRSRGIKQFNFHRNEFMPAAFLEYRVRRITWELGYMGSVYGWDSDSPFPEDSCSCDDVIEKIKLGWSYTFSETSRLQLSLSHVFSVWGFGGANIQFMHCF